MPETNRLFVSIAGTGQTGKHDYTPMIIAYNIKAKELN